MIKNLSIISTRFELKILLKIFKQIIDISNDLKKLVLFSLFLVFLVPSSAFGFADIENKEIVAESHDKDVVLSLEFGENQISRFDRIIPSFKTGWLAVGESIIEINNARTKIMGNSFVVHSENILIYAKGLGDKNYLINTYLLGDNHLDPIKLTTVLNHDVNNEIKDKSLKPNMIVLVQQDIKTFWNDTYDIEIKVFDKLINSRPQFYQSLGAINKAEIDVTLKDSTGKELTKLTGQTNSKGFWNGDFFVPQNLIRGGTYIVEVTVTYLDSINFQKLETFIISDTKDGKSSN